jgi:protein gp37
MGAGVEQPIGGETDLGVATFNGWCGCTEVSSACDNCYAEKWMDHRLHRVRWGANEPRVRTSPDNWKKPLAWQRKAAVAGVRRRVFAFSLADVFDNQVPVHWRTDFWTLIAQCPDLIWMLLTKRPQNIARMLPANRPWPNVWLGVTPRIRRNGTGACGC